MRGIRGKKVRAVKEGMLIATVGPAGSWNLLQGLHDGMEELPLVRSMSPG